MSIVYIQTNGVVVDDRVEDRSWVGIELGFIHGTEEQPVKLGALQTGVGTVPSISGDV